jgi:hypothetical protein
MQPIIMSSEKTMIATSSLSWEMPATIVGTVNQRAKLSRYLG